MSAVERPIRFRPRPRGRAVAPFSEWMDDCHQRAVRCPYCGAFGGLALRDGEIRCADPRGCARGAEEERRREAETREFMLWSTTFARPAPSPPADATAGEAASSAAASSAPIFTRCDAHKDMDQCHESRAIYVADGPEGSTIVECAARTKRGRGRPCGRRYLVMP